MHSRQFTSGQRQCRELVFSYGEASAVVRSDSQIVPGGRLQIQYDKVTTGFNVVRDLVPLGLIPKN